MKRLVPRVVARAMHLCVAAGCWRRGREYEYPLPEDGAAIFVCYEHRQEEGFCVCGAFAMGTEPFDFGPYRGYCDNCSSELRAEEALEQDQMEEMENEYP